MGNRAAKRRQNAGFIGSSKGKKNRHPRPFPILTPRSFLPGTADNNLYPNYVVPPRGTNQFPVLTPNSTLRPPPNRIESPPMNFNNEPGRQPIPSSIPMTYPRMNPMSIMQSSDSSYNSKFPSYPHHHHPIHLPDRCRSRPVIHIIESDSCSSISTCSTINSYRHRSYSYPRQRRIIKQQQQPIIFLPIKCQPSQQNILPTIQVQQQGQVLPSISNTNSTSRIIDNNQSMFQSSLSTSFENLQQTQTRPIQYVQEAPQLQFISVEPHSTTIPQHVLVNSTNKKQLNTIKPFQRSMTTDNLP